MPQPLTPAFTLADLHPADTFFGARTTWEKARWSVGEPYRLDIVPSHVVGVMGSMPIVAHRAVAAGPGLDFVVASGLAAPQVLALYDTEEEAFSIARDMIRAGRRMAYSFPPPPGLDGDASLVVPVPVYNRLNDKRNLAAVAGSANVPGRTVIPVAGARGHYSGRPVFLKAAIAGGNGGGIEVRYCASPAEWDAALDWFDERGGSDVAGLVVEEPVDAGTCWCMGAAILDDGVRYLGAAAQLFSAPAKQVGSIIDPGDAPPAEAVALTLAIAEEGRRQGYRGLAGFDMAVDRSGRVCVFDLNFRLNASTPMLLLFDAATRRAGASVALGWTGTATAPLGALIDRVVPLAEAGTFVPVRFYDATPQSRGLSMLAGMVVAGTAAEAARIAGEMTAALAAIAG